MHCSQVVEPVVLEVVPGYCRRPKMGRLPGQEELAAAEGTFVAAVEVAIERKDCFVDSTRPMHPCLDLPEVVVAAVAVHQRDPPQGQRAEHRTDFRMLEELLEQVHHRRDQLEELHMD